MKLKFVRKKILLVGVVLLSLAMLGQPALADDDDDDDQGITGRLLINSWHADFGVDQSVIRIWGQNFGDEVEVVTLDDGVLTIVSWADNEIVAELPGALDGDHSLCVYADDDDHFDCCALNIPAWGPSPSTGYTLMNVPVYMSADDAGVVWTARKSGNEAGAIGALKTITTSDTAHMILDDWGFASCTSPSVFHP